MTPLPVPPASALSEWPTGSGDPSRPMVPLVAGPLTVGYHCGDLRYVRLGNHEILRRIYGAVRGPNWETLPFVLREEHLEVEANSFRLRFRVEHHDGIPLFSWDGLIEGRADGSLSFSFSGVALATFSRNRIGLCVLHPLRTGESARCATRHADGRSHAARFPEAISATQPLPEFRELTGLDLPLFGDVRAEVRFHGEIFETEDQRHWLDASFKTYGTPVHLPRPVEITAGTRIEQRVDLRLSGPLDSLPPHLRSSETDVEEIRFGPLSGAMAVPLPALGLAAASHEGSLSRGELDRLARLCLAHLRTEVHLGHASWPARLRLHAREAMDLGVALELVVQVPAAMTAAPDLAPVVHELRQARADVARLLIFRDGELTTRAEDLQALQRAFADFGAPVGTGSAADFHQLLRPLGVPTSGADFVVWGMNPQAHASDSLSIAETPETVPHQFQAARRLFPGLHPVISPITLRPRFQLAAGEGARAPQPLPGGPPRQADPRQSSLFGAGWTLAMVQALAQAGAESATFFETTGWCGVLSTGHAAPLSNGWAVFPEAVFPIYHVLADLGEFAGGKAEPCALTHPTRLTALLLRHHERSTLLLANLGAQRETVEWTGPRPTRLRRLAAHQASEAARHPETFRTAAWTPVPAGSGVFPLALDPFEFVRAELP